MLLSRNSLKISSKLCLIAPSSRSFPLPSGSHKSLLQVHDFLFWGDVHLCWILDSSYKWYHMVFVFVLLTYFTQYESLFHPCCCKWHYVILFYGWVVFHCVYIYHIFRIQSSVDVHLGCFHVLAIVYHIFLIDSSVNGHLGCFHVFAIMNRAAMNMPVHVSFSRKILSRYMPKSGIFGSYGSSIFSFSKVTPYCFP